MKKQYAFFILLTGLIIIRCEKEPSINNENDIDSSNFIIDSVVNNNYDNDIYRGFSFYFKVYVDITKDYSIAWISPDSLYGVGPFKCLIKDSLRLKCIVTYDERYTDTLSLLVNENIFSIDTVVIKDYRDRVIGEYCYTIIHEQWSLGFPSNFDTNYFHGHIEKNNTNYDRIVFYYGEEIWNGGAPPSVIFAFSYKDPVLFNSGALTYPDFYSGETSGYYGSFINSDSLYLRISKGGLGGGDINHIYASSKN